MEARIHHPTVKDPSRSKPLDLKQHPSRFAPGGQAGLVSTTTGPLVLDVTRRPHGAPRAAPVLGPESARQCLGEIRR